MSKILLKNCRFMIAKPHPDGVFENTSILVDAPNIEAVGDGDEIKSLIQNDKDIDEVDCSRKLVMPGLVDSHNHLANYAFNLLPGVDPSVLDFDGISECLNKFIWPAHTWTSEESTYNFTLLSMMQAIKHGTTTITSAWPFPKAGYRAGVSSKMRLILHPQMVSNVELGDKMNDDEFLKNTEEVIRKYHNAEDGRIQVAVHPHATYSCTEQLLVKSFELAEKYDVGWATHLLEGTEDRRLTDAQFADRGGVIQYLGDLGILSGRSLFFHCDQMNREEMEIFAENGCAISHNPQSNADYHGTVADLRGMLKAGVTLGLGTDMPMSNMFTQMYTAYILHAVVDHGDPEPIMPWVPVELATIGGAKAQRLDDKIGTLEAGKRADIITVDLIKNLHLHPMNAGTLLFWIVSQGAGTIAEDVLVDGRFLRRDGEFTDLDEEEVVARSNEWLSKFIVWYKERKASNQPVTIRRYPDYENR